MYLWQVQKADVFERGTGLGTRWVSMDLDAMASSAARRLFDEHLSTAWYTRLRRTDQAENAGSLHGSQKMFLPGLGPDLHWRQHAKYRTKFQERRTRAGLWPSGTRTPHRKRIRVRHTFGVLHTATVKARRHRNCIDTHISLQPMKCRNVVQDKRESRISNSHHLLAALDQSSCCGSGPATAFISS